MIQFLNLKKINLQYKDEILLAIKKVVDSGWYIQGGYLLTGESRSYKFSQGVIGNPSIGSDCGAWELTARYSSINLNKDVVRGGSERNLTLGVNYFANKNVSFTLNYIKAGIHPSNDASKRNLNIVGGRVQIAF